MARMLRGGRDSLRAELSDLYSEQHDKVPSAKAAADAMLALEGRARRGDRLTPSLRVARYGQAMVLDLADQSGRVVIVDPDGWEVVDISPVLFQRTAFSGELPTPQAGGSLDELGDLLNLSQFSLELFQGWLVASLIHDIPHPIAALTGEQGAAKTWAARLLAGIIDPSPGQPSAPPRDLEGWATTAAGSWTVALDNVSVIPPWFSDALCRAVTGDATPRRRLYTDSDAVILRFRRAIVLNGIDLGAMRGDLADRLLLIELERITKENRREDAEVASTWADAHPRILGALLDLTSQVLAVLPQIKLKQMPRMADFSKVLAAMDRVRGTHTFQTYDYMMTGISEMVVEADQVSVALSEFLRVKRSWEGTASELLSQLTTFHYETERPPRSWPATSRAIAASLTRLAPSLRVVGISIERDPKARPRRWTLDMR